MFTFCSSIPTRNSLRVHHDGESVRRSPRLCPIYPVLWLFLQTAVERRDWPAGDDALTQDDDKWHLQPLHSQFHLRLAAPSLMRIRRECEWDDSLQTVINSKCNLHVYIECSTYRTHFDLSGWGNRNAHLQDDKLASEVVQLCSVESERERESSACFRVSGLFYGSFFASKGNCSFLSHYFDLQLQVLRDKKSQLIVSFCGRNELLYCFKGCRKNVTCK